MSETGEIERRWPGWTGRLLQRGRARNVAGGEPGSSLRARILEAGLFDTAFYARNNPDVVAAGVDPLDHFLRYGHLEGRWPSAGFDPLWYRETHLNGSTRVNPLLHYLDIGAQGGLATAQPLSAIREAPPAPQVESPPAPQSDGAVQWSDFRAFCVASGLFDARFYLASYDDVRQSGVDPFDHFNEHGWREGRDPSRLFSLEWYRETHLGGDTDTNPLRHYYERGVYRGFTTVHGAAEVADLGAMRRRVGHGRFLYPETPEVTIAVINLNGLEHLEDLVASLRALDYPACRVIVVDNGSSDGSADWLRRHAPEVQVIALDQNIGFADAVNLAFDHAPTQLFAVLNNDMVVDRRWLRELVEALRRAPQRAAVTSKIRFFKPFVTVSFTAEHAFRVHPADLLANHAYKKYFVETGRIGGDRVWSEEVTPDGLHRVSVKVPCEDGLRLPAACEGIPDGAAPDQVRVALNGVTIGEAAPGSDVALDAVTLRDAGRWVVNNAGSLETSEDVVGDRGFGQYDVGQYEIEENVDYLCGGSFLVNRAALHGRPLFIGDLFAYYEDTELSVRLRQDGFRIGYAPGSVVYHKHASTSEEKSVFFQRMVERNYSAFYARKRGAARAVTQVARKKAQLNHLSNFYATHASSTERERVLSTVYPEVMSQLDNLLAAIVNGREFHGSHRALRMAVYNSYWSTAGGGELHALNVADALTRFGIVDLIAESDFDLPELAGRFGLAADRFRKVLLADVGEADTAGYDVFVNSTFGSNLVSRAPHSYYIVSFPHEWATPEVLSSYTFLPNSLFTNHWCHTFWGAGVRSEVLYPLVRRITESGSVRPKDKVILHVGRFFPDGHCKMQHEMIETFRQLVAAHPEFADWTLVCAGGLDRSRQDCCDYFDAVAAAAEGANIVLRQNVDRAELDRLYTSAALYWHATGFGKDASREPYEFEHFGISTVEAMSAGCVPVVIADGGQPEIVYDAAFGSTFSSRADWIEKSATWMARFTDDPDVFAAASQAAAKAAERYQSDHFKERMDIIFADVERADAALYRGHLASAFTGETYWRLVAAPNNSMITAS